MPVNVDRFGIPTVARDIRHIKVVAHLAHPSAQRFHHVAKHEIVDVFRFVTQFFLQIHNGI